MRVLARASRAAVFASATLATTACWRESTTPPKPVTHTTPTPPTGTGPAAVQGRLYNQLDGTPIPNRPLSIVGAGREIAGTTDQYGRYRFDQLPPGEYVLRLAPDYRSSALRDTPITLHEGQTLQIDLSGTAPAVEHNIPMPYGAPPARRRIV